MKTGLAGWVVASAAALVALSGACSPPVNPAGEPLKDPSTKDAFGGVQCDAVRPQTEPDLMAWDPASRANLARLRGEGLVAVRYEAKGCNVELELLSNCIAPGAYKYAPYSANETKVAKNASELYAQLPIGAARLSGKLKGDRALRTDYMLVGTASVSPGTVVKQEELKGQGCERATHVVSTIYVGGFAMVAGESRQLDAQANLFIAQAGGSTQAAIERLDNEGNAEACKKAQNEGKESPICGVPLRVGLLALDHAKAKTSEAPVQVAPPSKPVTAPAAVSPTPAAPGYFEPSLIVGNWFLESVGILQIQRDGGPEKFKYVRVNRDGCKDNGTIQRVGNAFTISQALICPTARASIDKWQITSASESALLVTSPMSGATQTFSIQR